MRADFFFGNVKYNLKLIMEYKRYVQRNNQYLGFSDSDDEEFHMIVFDVSSLEEDELLIELLEENKLKVSFKHGFHDYGNLSFSRDCLYVYTLPETVQLTNLEAYWSEDNFLVIKEKKNCATERANKFTEDADVEKSKFDETINSSPAADENREMKQDTISLNGSSELEENVSEEKKSSISTSEQKMRERKSMSAASNSEEKAMKEMISKSSADKSEEKIMREMISKNASSSGVERILKEMISKSAAGKTEENIMQEAKSENASSENNENLMQIQDDKSRNTSNTVQTGSRLIPLRVPYLFNHTLTEINLQDAMNDIKKRIAFVNDFLDNHRFEHLI